MRFITNEPAILIGKTLIIADLHIGLEYDLARGGIHIPKQTERFAQKTVSLLEENKCDELIIIGDLKHAITGVTWPEKQEVTKYVEKVKETTENITLIKGNHDALIEAYLDIKVMPSTGLAYKNTWLLHGHASPPEEAFKKKHIIFGHIHPVIEFKDSLGGRISERVWLRYGKDPEIVCMPAFNDLLGGADIRKGIQGPMKKHMNLDKIKLYLLDGAELGSVKELSG